MRTTRPQTARAALLIAIAVAAIAGTASLEAQTTTTWNGGGGNTDWNNGLNWDQGAPPADVTTNAVIGAYTVDYSAPMVAGSFGTLTLNGVLNVNASGFVSGGGAALVSSSGARLFVNSAGQVGVTNGGLAFNSTAAGILTTGGSLSVQGTLAMGGSGAGNTGFLTNYGGSLAAASTTVNPNNISSSSLLVINGGNNSLGNVRIRRAGPSSLPALGTDGLAISNGTVNMASLLLNDGNSYGSMLVTGGAITNSGNFIVGQQTGGNSRAVRYHQLGGLVVSTIPDGIRLTVSNGTQTVWFSVLGGTLIAERLLLGDATNGAPLVVANFTNAGSVYLGGGGFATNNPTSYTIALNNGGTTGAKTAWSTSLPLLLNSGTHTFNAADTAGTGYDITLNGRVRGGGGMNKTGTGRLTLGGTNDYTGPTTVSQGTLALAATGSISNTTQITVGSGAIFDVSAVPGPALLAGQILNGNGAVVGNLAAASGCTLRPGGLQSPGTLIFSNGLSEAGGVLNLIDLSDDPTGATHPSDLIDVEGDLTLSGVNTVQINALNSTLPPDSAFKLIQYTGKLNGSLANLSLSGATGTLSNDVPGKAIYLVTGAAVRSPASVVWLGAPLANVWDTLVSSNWLNGTARDIFVTGDTVRFDDTGATNASVQIQGSVSPASLTVDTSSNYVFSGSGSIDGAGALAKTNTGTLTVLTTNGYAGSTIVGSGTLEVLKLANGGSASSLGTAPSDPANLQLFGSSLRYLGPSATVDRGATLNQGGGTIEITNPATTLTFGSLAGAGPFTKAGPGALVLPSDNTFTNGTIINGGTLQINTVNAAGTAGITNIGSTLKIGASTTITLPQLLDFSGSCTVDLNNLGGDTHLDGAWSGSGRVEVINQQSSARTFTVGGNGQGGGNLYNFSGTISMTSNSGSLRFNDGGGNNNLGSTNATIDLGTGSATLLVRNGGVTIDVGALLGGPNTRVTGRGSGSSGTVTYSVGGKNVSTLFEGTITNSTSGNTTAVTKVGTGTWTLAGISTYSGPTVISNGIIAVAGTGALANTPLIDIAAGAALDVSGRADGTLALGAGQVLSGEGIVRGSVSAQSGATLSPGEFPAGSPAGAGVVGILSIAGSLLLNQDSTLVMDIDKANNTNDVVTGASSITYGGTLDVSHFAGANFAVNDTFKLFSATAYSGAFQAITPATPGYDNSAQPLAWDTSYLTVDGTLRVTRPRPVIGSMTLSGTDLVLSGTNGVPGGTFYVLGSTNVALALPSWTRISTNAFDFFGNFNVTNSIGAGTPKEFFTLETPGF